MKVKSLLPETDFAGDFGMPEQMSLEYDIVQVGMHLKYLQENPDYKDMISPLAKRLIDQLKKELDETLDENFYWEED